MVFTKGKAAGLEIKLDKRGAARAWRCLLDAARS